MNFFIHLNDSWIESHARRRSLTTGGKPRNHAFILVLKSLPLVVIAMIPAGYLGLLSVERKVVEQSGSPDPVNTERWIHMPDSVVIRDGRPYHKCEGGEGARSLTRKYYSYSTIFQPDELERAFQSELALAGGRCEPGVVVAIPEPLLEKIQNRTLGWPDSKPVRAVYLRGDLSVPRRIREEADRLLAAGGNAIVFDVKDILGVVNYHSTVQQVEEYRKHRPTILDLPKMIRYLHSRRVYVIARMALFQDARLAAERPDLSIKDVRSPGGILLVKGRPLWVDPALPQVRDYNLQLVEEMVRNGVDEIQFDYVRYPAEGDLSGVRYTRVLQPEDKVPVLAEFLQSARQIAPGNSTRLAIDVFGVVAWGEKKDIQITGQDLERLSAHVDVISPMLYPSHFQPGFDGIARPADEGEYFYRTGVEKVMAMVRPGVVVRPWVQAFGWRVTRYNEDYIRDQIRGIDLAGGKGWLMWNAASNYDTVYRATTPPVQ